MTKYRIRLRNGRVIGPFIQSQLFELKSKGHIQGTEEAQLFPTGNWEPLDTFDFFSDLMNVEFISGTSEIPKDETFVIDLAKLRQQKNEKEIELIDVTSHEPVSELTETIQLKSQPIFPPKDIKAAENKKIDKPQEKKPEVVLETETMSDHEKTTLNPIAQRDLERIRKERKEEEERLKSEEEVKKAQAEEKEKKEIARKLIEADESTQIIKLDSMGSDLMVVAQEEEIKIEKEAKAIKKKKRKEALQDQDNLEDEETEKVTGKENRFKIFMLIAVIAIGYAIIYPSDDTPKVPPFSHLDPVIEFPVPFDKADTKRAKIEFDKGMGLFISGDYPSLIKAGVQFKSSFENNMENEDILGMLVRDYAEQLKFSKDDFQGNAQIIFNLIQSKRPFLVKNPNGVIGLNLFYMAINKPEAAADVVAKYLKVYPNNVTEDLFAVYLMSLIKLGRVDLAKQFNTALEKTVKKNRYTFDALIEYSHLNQDSDLEERYTNEALKNYPKLVGFYLKKADLLIKSKKIKEAEKVLAQASDLGLENNNNNRATYLYLKGMTIAYGGDVKKATEYFAKSLALEDSNEIRMRLADLQTKEGSESDTDKLIRESKAIKLIMQAKDFFEKRSYELALSSAARAADLVPHYIPAQLFLSKVQLRLGLAKQALKNLEILIKKYPDDKNLNLALLDAYIETYKFNDAKTRIGIMSASEIKNSFEFASANGRLYMRMGDPLQAINWFKSSINMNPLNDRDIYLLSELLIKRANFDTARILLNKCMELDPVNPDYRIAYSKIVYEQQDDLAAIGYLLGLMDEFGENPKILSEIAIFYYRAGKVKDFQAYKEKLEKLPTKDKSLYEFLIRAALLDERFNEIPQHVESLLRIEPGDLESMMTAAKVLYENGKLVEAAKWLKRIQDKLESYPKVQFYIAKIKYLSKDYEGALKDVEDDLKANGDNDADLTLMAQIYIEKGDLVQAENLFKKSQKINPKSFDSLVGLADISTKRNNYEFALDLYKRAMREKGDEAIIHRKIGDVYRLLGQGVLAVESYKLYLEMKPEASDKAQIESYINLME